MRAAYGQENAGANRSDGKPKLTEQLLKEDPAGLAEEARRKGDSVRGAILFSQKEFNCVGCHAQGANDLLGPDLSRLLVDAKAEDRSIDDAYYVDAILRPSKEIRPAFSTTTFLLIDGRIVRGRILKADDLQVVIRDASDPSRSMTIPREQIDKEKADTKSVMPEELADQLPSRQAFLDIVKYVMELSATGTQTESIVMLRRAGGAVEELVGGRVMLDTHGCVRCHPVDDANRNASNPQASHGPDLTNVAGRIDPVFLAKYISDPHRWKPGTSMPDVMHHLQPELRATVTTAITDYLKSLTEDRFERQVIESQDVVKGERLFHSVGCVACHNPRDSTGHEKELSGSVALGDVFRKYSVASLTRFLKDPHAIRPSGRMPNLKLNHFEALEIASFLLQQSDDLHDHVSDESVEGDELADRVEMGRLYFQQIGCARCHHVDDAAESDDDAHKQIAAGGVIGATRLPSFSEMELEKGCLSGEEGAWPNYELTPKEVVTLREAVRTSSKPLSDSQRISSTMASLRCYSCHSRDGIGGVTEDRDDYFATANENLGPQGRIPPTLSGVGAKLNPKWMRQVLVSGRAIRPYVQTRMPKYAPAHVEELIALLQKHDQLPSVEFFEPKDPKEFRKTGTELVGRDGLNCIACHTFQQKPAQTMPAVDLTEMAERLKPAWFDHYMRSPQTLSPNTVMPSFWPGGKAIRREILEGATDQQIAAVWEYLQDGRQARTPRGLRIEPIELLADEEHAVMLRRKYQDIGKRGIGVGYPEQVNLAFDAEQMRVASIWKGKFADPGAAWRGQGSGNVRPLGSELVRFAAGPEVDHAESPWVADEGRPPHHQFKGYALDEQSRPQFAYRCHGVDVQDYIVDQPAGKDGQRSLVRKIVLDTSNKPASDEPAETAHPPLAFRIRSTESMSLVDDDRGGVRIGSALRVWTEADHSGEIIADDGTFEYVIPLDLSSGKTTLILHYAW